MKKSLILLLLVPLLSFGQENLAPKLITVVGTVDIEVDPDIVIIGITARETENIKKESDLVNMENELLLFYTSIGQSKDNFVIDRYTANSNVFSSSSRIKLNKTYSMKIEDVLLLDTLVTKCYELGFENVYVKHVDHSQIEEFKFEILKGALRNARKKAEIMAQEMDLKLGSVESINESYVVVNNQPYAYFYDDLQLDEVVVVGYGTGRSSSNRISSSISLNKIQLRKTVIVKYNIL